MSNYVEAFRGYVADVPEFWFKRIDGKVYHFDELTDASVTPDVQFTEVNAGWSLYPVAYLPAQSSLVMTLTSGQFDSSLFELANGSNFKADATATVPVSEQFKLTAATMTLSTTKKVTPKDIVINGLTYSSATSAPNAGYFTVAQTGDDGSCTTVITVNYAADDSTADFHSGDVVDLTYYEVQADAVSLDVTNDQAAIGEAILKWPVYNGGEAVSDTAMTGNSIKGYLTMQVYRCRVTAMPGFDTSYKSAATNQIELSTMDPKNTNGKAYKLTYIPN